MYVCRELKPDEMKKQDFLNDVEYEVKMLKKHATEKELDKMDFNKLNSQHPEFCIYGQITGDCQSKRAKILMDKSCIRVMDIGGGARDLLKKTFLEIKKGINGKNNGQGWLNDGGDRDHVSLFGKGSRDYRYLSVLEGYICTKGAKTEHIIQYLKGEIETLKL